VLGVLKYTEFLPGYPEFLPNGKDFLFSVRDSGVYLASLEGGKIVNPVRLMENGHQASYTLSAPADHSRDQGNGRLGNLSRSGA